MSERIVAAAICEKGEVVSLPRPARHHHIIAHIVGPLREGQIIIPATGEQGFITDTGRFVDRTEAGRIAIESGQIAKLEHPPLLFSEDLW